MEYLCTLGMDTGCECLEEDKTHCKAYTKCSFCREVSKDITENNKYVRKPRWYEKYYRKGSFI